LNETRVEPEVSCGFILHTNLLSESALTIVFCGTAFSCTKQNDGQAMPTKHVAMFCGKETLIITRKRKRVRYIHAIIASAHILRQVSCMPVRKPTVILVLVLMGWGGLVSASYSPPLNYYVDAADKSGAALKEALHDIIDDHIVKSYSAARTILQVLDADPDNINNVLLAYSGYSVNGTWDSGATWNREHLWPQSRGVDSGPSNSDLFNLWPCNPGVNSSRGNKWFDNSEENDRNYTFPAHPQAPQSSYDNDSWQPRSSEQGDIARAMFYMDTRYDHLSLTNVVTTSSQMGTLSTLIEWHLDDPVDESERRRNHLIFSDYQVNRNPYVDDSEYAMLVYGMPEPTGIFAVMSVLLFFCRKVSQS